MARPSPAAAVCVAAILICLARLDVGASTPATPTAAIPVPTVETTLDVQPRDDGFPSLTSRLTISIPSDWPEAEWLLATPSGSPEYGEALAAILLRVGLASPDAPDEAVPDLLPTAPEVTVDGGVVTIAVGQTDELRDEFGVDLGMWWIELGPCAVVERAWPEPSSSSEASMDDETGPSLQWVGFNQPCNLHVSLESPGSCTGDECPEAPAAGSVPVLVAEVSTMDSGLVAAFPMPDRVSDGYMRWTFPNGPLTWAAEAEFESPATTRRRFKAISGLSTLQPLGVYFGPAAVLLSACILLGRRSTLRRAEDADFSRDSEHLKCMTIAALFLLDAGISSWYAIRWLQEWAGEQGKEWLAALYFGVAALPFLGFAIVASAAAWCWSGTPTRRGIMLAVLLPCLGVLGLMALLSVSQATADPEASTLSRDHAFLQWLPIAIPILATTFLAYGYLRPALSPNGTASEIPQTGLRGSSLQPDVRLPVSIGLVVFVVVGSWLLLELAEERDLLKDVPGVSIAEMLKGILTFSGFFYAFEFVSEIAAITPLIVLIIVTKALHRLGKSTSAVRLGKDETWLRSGIAILFAAFVIGQGVPILGIQIPIGFLVTLMLFSRNLALPSKRPRPSIPRTTPPKVGDPGEPSPNQAMLPHPFDPDPAGATWWDNATYSAKWGVALAVPMVGLLVYVLISDDRSPWFESSPAFRLVRLLVLIVNEAAVWLVAAFVFGCLYATLPGCFGWIKGLVLASVFAVAHGAELLARVLTGEHPEGDWLFRPLQITLFLMVLGVVLEMRTQSWAGLWGRLTVPLPVGQRWLDRLVGIVGYLTPVTLAAIAVVEQILAGNAAAALTEIIAALPDLVSPFTGGAT